MRESAFVQYLLGEISIFFARWYRNTSVWPVHERGETHCAVLDSRHSSRNSGVKLRWAHRLSSLCSFAVNAACSTRRPLTALSMLLTPWLERPALPDKPVKPIFPTIPPC